MDNKFAVPFINNFELDGKKVFVIVHGFLKQEQVNNILSKFVEKYDNNEVLDDKGQKPEITKLFVYKDKVECLYGKTNSKPVIKFPLNKGFKELFNKGLKSITVQID